MAARQRKDIDKTRTHIYVPTAWLDLIDRAAAKLGIARSNFISAAAYDAAVAAFKKGKK